MTYRDNMMPSWIVLPWDIRNRAQWREDVDRTA